MLIRNTLEANENQEVNINPKFESMHSNHQQAIEKVLSDERQQKTDLSERLACDFIESTMFGVALNFQ